MYRPSTPFSVPIGLLVPTKTYIKGVYKPQYPPKEDAEIIYGGFRSFGGSERQVNNITTVVDTAVIDTWYRPDITADCRFYIPQTGAVYEVEGTPENIEMRNQYLRVRVRKVGA